MDDLRKIQLYILDQVSSLLEENGLDYWLDSGTLLGARRHEGFIPWDDDIDISVHMKDYMNVVTLLVEKLPENLKIENNGWDAMSAELAPIKIFYIPSMIEDCLSGKQTHIFIDLFVYSPIKPEFIKSKRSNLLKYLLVAKSKRLNPNLTGIKQVVYKILKAILSKKMLNRLMGNIRKSHLNSDYLAYDYLCWPAVAVHHKNEMFPLRKMIFEGKLYKVPNDVDSFLSKKYGSDFMVLPPVEKRIGNHISHYEIIEFPNE